jgi:hypothetical protein
LLQFVLTVRVRIVRKVKQLAKPASFEDFDAAGGDKQGIGMG